MVVGLGFRRLITCFDVPRDKRTNATGEQAAVCKERVDLQQAKIEWESFFRGTTTMRDLFREHGTHLCMVCPERTEALPTLVAKLQRELFELHQEAIWNPKKEGVKDWSLGLLINVAKFPFMRHENVENIALGLHMTKQEFMDIHLWPFIDKVLFLRPPKDLQVSSSFRNPTPIKVVRYFGVIIMTGDNTQALNMVENANKGVRLANSDHPHKVRWGAMRSDLNWLEKSIKEKSWHKPLVKTWRYQHTPFPKCQVQGNSPTLAPSIETSHKWSIDFCLTDGITIGQWDSEIKKAVDTWEVEQKWVGKFVLASLT